MGARKFQLELVLARCLTAWQFGIDVLSSDMAQHISRVNPRPHIEAFPSSKSCPPWLWRDFSSSPTISEFRHSPMLKIKPHSIVRSIMRNFILTFALLGGGGVFEHSPCGFSRIVRKRRRAAPPGFHLPYPPSFWQLL